MYFFFWNRPPPPTPSRRRSTIASGPSSARICGSTSSRLRPRNVLTSSGPLLVEASIRLRALFLRGDRRGHGDHSCCLYPDTRRDLVVRADCELRQPLLAQHAQVTAHAR